MQEEPLDVDSDPLDYWRKKKDKKLFPNLRSLARYCFS